MDTLRELAHRLRAGDISAVMLLEQSRARIDHIDGRIGAFTWLSPTAADEAASLDREAATGRWRGPLHGIPVGVKELFDVAGAPQDYGSLAPDRTFAPADARIVALLRQAGAVIVGTTRSHEFGWGITTQHSERGSTANPADETRVPGGSSGGAAAAVAAGMVPLAIASDTGGSIRIPAAFCGVAGIKPSFGRISRRGGVSLAPSLDTPGFIAGRVADLVDALMAASGQDPADPATVIADLPDLGEPVVRAGLDRVRIGYSPDLIELTAATARVTDYYRVLDVARSLGATVVELRTPPASEFRRVFATVQMAEARTVHARELRLFPGRAGAYGTDVLGRLEAAGSVDVGDYLTAVAERAKLHAHLLESFGEVDALLTPISTVAPPLRSTPDTVMVDGVAIPLREAVMGLTTPQNLSGLPAVAFRAGLSADGLPVGFQLTTGRGQELYGLAIAAAIEDAVLDHGTNTTRSPGS